MENLVFSSQNIIDGQGIGLAITGMSIVFSALAFIALFIHLLPKVLALLAPYLPEKAHHPVAITPPEHNDEELVAAIGYLLWRRQTGPPQSK